MFSYHKKEGLKYDIDIVIRHETLHKYTNVYTDRLTDKVNDILVANCTEIHQKVKLYLE